METGVPEIDNCTADYIIGSDECGYGAWAGPLVVCAAIISREWPLAATVTDSKKLSHTRRVALSKKILGSALCHIIQVSAEDVDEQGVYKALLDAHTRAIQGVRAKHEAQGCLGTDLVVVDGTLPIEGAISLPKADGLIPAVSAASIVGKVFRDIQMEKLAEEYPGYGLEKHKGYGVPAHLTALEKLGPCDIHRKSYAPIRRLLEATEQPVDPFWEDLPQE